VFYFALLLMTIIIFAAVIAWFVFPVLRKSLEEPKFGLLENSKRIEDANLKPKE
jgi:hypothetical protein